MSRWVVVGADFSEGSDEALRLAAEVAVQLGCGLRVVHALNESIWSADLIGDAQALAAVRHAARQGAETALRARIEPLRERLSQIESAVVTGPASRVLPQETEARDVALLVVGRRGSARLSHVLLGSVSERAVRAGVCPVLVVPKTDAGPKLPRRMLVGIDFSDAAREALVEAVRLGQGLGCEAGPVLAHAYQDERALWLASWSETGRKLSAEHDVDSVRRWAERETPAPTRFDVEVLEGVAESVLPEVARRTGCDWIVVGLQGRTALASFLIGSTTRHVLETADRPVLVVPPSRAPEIEPGD